jgi:hypothetical protein
LIILTLSGEVHESLIFSILLSSPNILLSTLVSHNLLKLSYPLLVKDKASHQQKISVINRIEYSNSSSNTEARLLENPTLNKSIMW